MAKKLEVYYIRDISSKPLGIVDLKNIINISPNIRLSWGNEYVDFNFTTPVDIDLDVEEALQLFHGGKIPIGMYPTGGSYNLLGHNASQYSIEIKFYSLEEFCEISKKATELTAMNIPLNKACIPKGIQTHDSNGGFIYKDLFHEVRVRSYADYSWIITDLEQSGFVDTFPSENILRTDERRFILKPTSELINPDLKSYVGQTFEVDSLGTSFYSELSKGIVFLSSRYFKDIAFKESSLDK